jgi:hypothetical protein
MNYWIAFLQLDKFNSYKLLFWTPGFSFSVLTFFLIVYLYYKVLARPYKLLIKKLLLIISDKTDLIFLCSKIIFKDSWNIYETLADHWNFSSEFTRFLIHPHISKSFSWKLISWISKIFPQFPSNQRFSWKLKSLQLIWIIPKISIWKIVS